MVGEEAICQFGEGIEFRERIGSAVKKPPPPKTPPNPYLPYPAPSKPSIPQFCVLLESLRTGEFRQGRGAGWLATKGLAVWPGGSELLKADLLWLGGRKPELISSQGGLQPFLPKGRKEGAGPATVCLLWLLTPPGTLVAPPRSAK